MKKSLHYPLIVIGAGAGGLVPAIGWAKAGKKVLLIEKGNYGGDCTNFGCIPSKAIIAAAETAHAFARAKEMGIEANISFDAKGVLTRTKEIVRGVREKEEPEALAKLGVDTLTGLASFTDPQTLDVATEGGATIRVSAETIILATGSYPAKPDIEGIDEVPYLTNETVFNLSEIPEKLAILGGGPIGCELAQAFHRLGSKVALIQHAPRLLMKEEPESQKVIEETFRKEGIELFLSHEPKKIAKEEGRLIIACCDKSNNRELTCPATHLLVAAGRRPAIEKLNLKAAGVDFDKKGIQVDRYGRTSQSRIWAIGDCTGQAPFTHMAEHAGRRVLYNLLVPRLLRKKEKEPWNVPRVTFTDPEIAAFGLLEKDAVEKYGKSRLAIYFFPFSKLDRAITAGRTEGFVKVITKKWSSKIIGATVAGPRAGEMILELEAAMHAGIPLRKLADVIHPYPTYSLAIRKASDMWLNETLLPALKKISGKK